MNKHLIWSDIDLSLKDWEIGLREHYEDNNLNFDDYDENHHCTTMQQLNDMYLDDERGNLDKRLGNTIIVIADLGFWNGRKQGYKLIESGNIKDCLGDSNCDSCEWYVDEHGDMRFVGHHHDGTHYYLYRVFKKGVTDDQINALTSAIYEESPNVDALVKRYTNRIGTHVGKVYGWKFKGCQAA